MPENPFSESYARLSNSSLLKILSRAKDYQPLAVETARAELQDRQLSQEAYKEASLELEKEQRVELEEQEKREVAANRMREKAMKLFDSLNPVRKKASSSAQMINIICLLLMVGFLYSAVQDYAYFQFLITQSSPSLSLILILSFGLLYTPLTTILFWKRKKAGWVLLAIYLCVSIYLDLLSLVQCWRLRGIVADRSLSEKLIPVISPGPILLSLVFYMAVILFICKPRLRVFYRVKQKPMFGIIGLTALILVIITCIYVG